MAGSTIILKIGCDLEASENMVCLSEPADFARGPCAHRDGAVQYITALKPP
jgi:hypothetical protein